MNRRANADEAAAIAAAIQQFVAETTPAAGAPEETESPWQRAALLEGVNARRMTIQDLEGGVR
jgi:hypothetical protein